MVFGCENGGFGRSFFDKIQLLDKKIDFAKIALPSRRNAYFQGFATNFCTVLGSKNGCQKRHGKKMQKNVQKKGSGSKFGALGCVLDGLGRDRAVRRASQERFKTAPRFGEEWVARPL